MPPIPDLHNLLLAADATATIIQIDIFICEVCTYGDNIHALTPQQQYFFFDQIPEREINNGVFRPYFHKITGDYAHETLLSLNAVGTYGTAATLRGAINQFPNQTVPTDRNIREYITEQIAAPATPVREVPDERFLAYTEDLKSLQMEYIREHPEYFKVIA